MAERKRGKLMDPLTDAVVGALSSVVTSGATEAAKKVIIDGYDGLKALIRKKLGGNNEVSKAIDNLEAKPDSSGRRETLTEEVTAAKADADPELVSHAQSLLALVQALPKTSLNVQNAQGIGIVQIKGRRNKAKVSISGAPLSGGSAKTDG